MGLAKRGPDIVDQHIALRERVRKLEMQHQSKTLRPWRWTPDKREDRISVIAQHSLLMGFGPYLYENAGSINVSVTGGDYDLIPGVSALHCQAAEISEGYSSSALARQFMIFRQKLGVYPTAFRRIQTGVRTRLPYLTGPFPDYDDNQPSMVYTMAGPTGNFFWMNGGQKMIGSDADPGIPSPGGYIAGSTPDGPDWWYGGARNSMSDLGTDCGEPGPPLDNGSIPGRRISWFEGTYFGCPANRFVNWAVGGTGGIYRYIYQPTNAFYFESPPVMWSGQSGVAPPANSWHNYRFQGIPTFPGFNIETRVAYGINRKEFSLVKRWYDQHLPVHHPPSKRYWQTLQMYPYYTGSAEILIIEALLSMRGFAVLNKRYPVEADYDPAVTPFGGLLAQANILSFPRGLRPQSDYLYMPVRYHAHDGVDKIGSVIFQWGYYPDRITCRPAGALYDEIHRYPSRGPFTIYFDGARFEIKPESVQP